MRFSNIFDLDPELLFPIFYNYYYSEVFTGNDINNIEIDSTYETITYNTNNTNNNSNFNENNNPYLYAIVPNKYTKSIIKYSCPNYSFPCILAQINPSTNTVTTNKTVTKTTDTISITYNEVSKLYLNKYFDFLRHQENGVKEGRWGLPALDSDGKKTYIVFNEYKINGQTVITTKTTKIPNKNVEEVITNPNGSTTTIVYKPYYIKSKAHPGSTKYGYVLDLKGQKVQQTVPTLIDRVLDSRWFVHQDFKGINTIAYGHQILTEEISSNKIKISETEYAVDWINKGLTDEQAFKLLIYDYKKHEAEARAIIEAPRWNALPDMYKITLVEVTYNGGGVRNFPNLCSAMGIPPKMGNTTYFWPSVKVFKLESVNHQRVKIEFNRPDVPVRDQSFKSIFF